MPDSYQFLDVFPVRNDEALEAEFIAKNIGQDVMIDVAGNAIDLCGVNHDGMRAGFDSRVEGRQEIFPQIILRDPGRCSISTVKRKTVAHVMLQAGRNVVL